MDDIKKSKKEGGPDKKNVEANNLNADPKKSDGLEEPTSNKPKKMVGPGFWLMLFIVLIKDLIDLVADFSVILSVIAPVTGFIVTLILWFYYYYNGVKASTRTVATFAITSLIGSIPFINILPESVLNLILIRTFENNQKLKKIVKIASVNGAASTVAEAV